MGRYYSASKAGIKGFGTVDTTASSLFRVFMHRYIIFIVITLLCSCSGGEGHIGYYSFIISKSEAKIELDSVIFFGGHSVPKHWNDYELGKHADDIFIYFKTNPTEIYLVGFNDYDDKPRYKDKTVLALIGVFNGEKWLFSRDLNQHNKTRVSERFQTEILSKLKYNYLKIDYP